jgi:hypothetical protein
VICNADLYAPEALTAIFAAGFGTLRGASSAALSIIGSAVSYASRAARNALDAAELTRSPIATLRNESARCEAFTRVPCSRRLAPALLRVTAPLASMAGKIRRLFVAQEVEDGLYF